MIGLKHADDFWTWAGTVIAIVISFYLMIIAGRKLPLGTVYAVFVGLSATRTVFSDIIFLGEAFKISKVLLILILLGGVTGLSLVTQDTDKERAKS